MPLVMTVKAVFFDAGNTLFRLRRSVGHVYAEHAAACGVRLDPQRLDAAFSVAFGSAPPLAFPEAGATLPALERAWWRAVVAHTVAGHAFPDFDRFFDAVYDAFATAEPWVVYPDTVPTLRALTARGMIVGVISNFDTRLVPLCGALGLAPLLDSITVSSEVGAAKPDPRIFQAALRRHRLAPAEALHAGDSLAEDVRGAERAGMRAVLVRSPEAPGLQPGVFRALGSNMGT